MAKVMVELERGYGDGYGVVAVDDTEKVIVNPAREVPRHYRDGWPIAEWRRAILAQPSVDLIDDGVRVPPGAIVRIIGPLDCPEAARIRARRYTKNWGDSAFVGLATDAEIVEAMCHDDEPSTRAACRALRAKYAESRS